MIKTVTNLIEKAQERENGFARVNGRMGYYYGGRGPLREKYAVQIDGAQVSLYHWGTHTLTVGVDAGRLLYFYGVSNSDRDSCNTVLRYFGLDGGFRYFPSKDEYIFEIDGVQSDEVYDFIEL